MSQSNIAGRTASPIGFLRSAAELVRRQVDVNRGSLNAAALAAAKAGNHDDPDRHSTVGDPVGPAWSPASPGRAATSPAFPTART